jgi:hypothetical protein
MNVDPRYYRRHTTLLRVSENKEFQRLLGRATLHNNNNNNNKPERSICKLNTLYVAGF